ncbi:hypothetical protein BLNAU_6733 [Blattamonas nauphoetae]|uniref:Uncharacterized protein n=1 Tax=Blattamonas nauphoetae TaxID=2049346 RepID=A0ABQ9Y3E9_9EUKA|nr:hypothetical protein BLNAU_6733 [Blattamonas nauphoetae]
MYYYSIVATSGRFDHIIPLNSRREGEWDDLQIMSIEVDGVYSQHISRTGSVHPVDSGLTDRIKPSALFNFDPDSNLTFEDKSAIYQTLVSLVRDNFDFDDVLQDKVTRFLKKLEPQPFRRSIADRLITNLVRPSDESSSGFIDSACILLSSPHSKIVTATLSFLQISFSFSSETQRVLLVQTDFIPRILAILRPQTLQLSGNEALFNFLNQILHNSIGLALSSAQHNRCELILQQVIQPSSQYLSFLCQNQ